MKLNPELIHRSILDEDIFIPIGQTALERCGVYVMSPVGARIWELLASGMDTSELIPALLEEYEVEQSVLQADVEEFLADLTRLGMLLTD